MRAALVALALLTIVSAASSEPRNRAYWLDQYSTDASSSKFQETASCAVYLEYSQKAATCTDKNVATLYQNRLATIKKARLRDVGTSMTALGGFTVAWFAAGDNPDGTHSNAPSPLAAVDACRKQIDGLIGCISDDEAAGLRAPLQGLEEEFTKRMATEATCRKTPTCMADRTIRSLTPEICTLILQKRGAEQGIATERRNPAGVVNLVLLHDFGATIQDLTVQIRDAKARYRKAANKPFADSLCNGMTLSAE